jgi:hypothetical protein
MRKTASSDGDVEGIFDGASSAEWGLKIASAASKPEPKPFVRVGVGAEKIVAEEVPFDLFSTDSSAYGTAARSLASMAVNRKPEERVRFAGPSPRLVNAAAAVLRKATSKLRGSYTVEDLVLEGVDFAKVAAVDGAVEEGEMRWHMTLADHARNRRGAIDMVVKIVGGAPIDAVSLLANGRSIAFTRSAIDQHLGVRRATTRGAHCHPRAERAFIEE